MEPAQSSETTMSERPYLTFRSASRRARHGSRGGGARGALRSGVRRAFSRRRWSRRLAATALLTRYGCSDAHSPRVTPENTSNSSVSCSDPFGGRLSLSMLIRCLLGSEA